MTATEASIEETLIAEVRPMTGVRTVAVKRSGNSFDIAVVMENMDFEPFNAVVGRELDFYRRFPEFTFNFDLTPASSLS